MSFPGDVSEKALVSCGRHCCLCHKFCGTKIELHHIKQKADGGEDSFENCIPLCFDCHAEVKAYNPKHPKGKKYTENELKQHRDNWYSKVRNSGGNAVNVQYVELDRKVYEEIKSMLHSNGAMGHIKENNFTGCSFNRKWLDPLHEFEYACERPDFEFIDVDLEASRLKMLEKIAHFTNVLATETFPIDDKLSEVPREWEIEQPNRYWKVVIEITEAKMEVWDAYCEFIKLSRRKLGA